LGRNWVWIDVEGASYSHPNLIDSLDSSLGSKG